MLVVTDVKVAEIPRNIMEMDVVFDTHESIQCTSAVDPTMPRVRVTRDTIRGRSFEHHGRTYVIGWARQVQDALGIPFEVYGNMKKEIQHLKGEVHRLREELNKNKGR